jgi:AmmeMemoRadiSam system protein B
MSIQNFSLKQIQDGLANYEPTAPNRVRVIFVEEHINEGCFENACKLYSNLKDTSYDDVIIIERLGHNYDKLLPMVSNTTFITPLGPVEVNDQLRNEFCDEDDDFFIDDEGYSDRMCIYDHLMMLQSVLGQFRVLSIQVADERPSIVRELASAVTELMRDRNALIVVCSNISGSSEEALENIRKMIDENEFSRLLNYLNTGDAGILGRGPFAAGVLISNNWELVNHLSSFDEHKHGFLSGFAAIRDYNRPK